MLFNSFAFLLGFLPIVCLGYFAIGKYSHTYSLVLLAVASVLFYGYWNYRFIPLLAASILLNYFGGTHISRINQAGRTASAKILLTSLIAINLALLSYFKYANFFIESYNNLANAGISKANIILPIGISFYTFTQIAFLVDVYQNTSSEFNFLRYILFVTYFPHLIAGPILHHKEMMSQFAKKAVCRVRWDSVSGGFSLLILGLAKKVLIADQVAKFSSPVFLAVSHGGTPMMFEAWMAAIAYTLQIYFDFSAYSDMAVGISLMFNIRLPINFNSPYKSKSIIEFWRRWHMSLSRFLRDYLYIPLGGNRKGLTQRHINLMVTMLLGGLWHGAGWTFIVWGGLHGSFLVINHVWQSFAGQHGWNRNSSIYSSFSWIVTFLCVVVGWVIFRSESMTTATAMLKGMAGFNGMAIPQQLATHLGKLTEMNFIHITGFTPLTDLDVPEAAMTLIIPLLIAVFLPNALQVMQSVEPVIDSHQFNSKFNSKGSKWQSILIWRESPVSAILLGITFYIVISQLLKVGESEFLYFQF